MSTKRNKFSSFLGSPIWQVLSVLIAIAALILTVLIPTYESRIDQLESEILALQGELQEKESKLADLSLEIQKRDDEILNLQEKLKLTQSTALQEVLSKDGKAQFEWQWAGENWYGQLTFEAQGANYIISQATLGLLEKTKEDTVWMAGQVLDMAPGTVGTFRFTENGIELDLTVEKKSRRDGTIGITTINGSLQPTLCYAGTVTYSDLQGSYTGDMVLVNYISILSSQVDDWFANKSKRTWFETYLIDR